MQASHYGCKPRLLLADDHRDVLKETRDLLAIDFDVVGTAPDGLALLTAAGELQPDVIVTDVNMPKMNGLEASREILRRGLCRAIVLLTVDGDAELARTAFDVGILGYVLKVSAGEELITAVRAALDGEPFISATVGV